MLKIFSLFLITLGLVSAAPKAITVEQAWTVIPTPLTGSQCLYVSELRVFSCRGYKLNFVLI